jgi:hypothetical protein
MQNGLIQMQEGKNGGHSGNDKRYYKGVIYINFEEQSQILFSIVIVILGGFVTYHFTTSIDKRKYRRDLKKETYFDLLDLVGELMLFMYYLQHFQKEIPGQSKQPTNKKEEFIQSEIRAKRYEKEEKTYWDLVDWIKKFAIINNKVKICGSEDVILILDKNANLFKNYKEVVLIDVERFEKFESLLISAIRKDLMNN